jgi:hypothetical protein
MLGKEQVTKERGAVWAPDPISMVFERRIFLDLAGIRTLDRSASG